ncbi:hypothetical protein PYCC9005_003146 [Savitreella phatthalungensis]
MGARALSDTDTAGSPPTKPSNSGSVSVGASSAVSRSLVGQILALWFRVPVKLFRPTRVDFMILPRALHSAGMPGIGDTTGSVPLVKQLAAASHTIPAVAPTTVPPAPQLSGGAIESWGNYGVRAWRNYVVSSGPVVLTQTIRKHGWRFVPDYILPPLLANSLIGIVLYTTYIETLGILHPPSRRNPNDPTPPPPFTTTLKAGAVAGLAQSVVSQPVDALKVRFEVSRMLHGDYRSMWHYCVQTIREVGVKPLFGGFLLGATKDTLAMGFFFATFEVVKNQWQDTCLRILYGTHHLPLLGPMQVLRGYREEHRAVHRSGLYMEHQHAHEDDSTKQQVDTQGLFGHIDERTRPHWIFSPAFLLLAGLSASFAHTAVHFPMSKLQEVHLTRLECADYRQRYDKQFARRFAAAVYVDEYRKTYAECARKASRAGGWMPFLTRGFWQTALRSSPATAVGLVIFELFRTHLIED